MPTRTHSCLAAIFDLPGWLFTDREIYLCLHIPLHIPWAADARVTSSGEHPQTSIAADHLPTPPLQWVNFKIPASVLQIALRFPLPRTPTYALTPLDPRRSQPSQCQLV